MLRKMISRSSEFGLRSSRSQLPVSIVEEEGAMDSASSEEEEFVDIEASLPEPTISPSPPPEPAEDPPATSPPLDTEPDTTTTTTTTTSSPAPTPTPSEPDKGVSLSRSASIGSRSRGSTAEEKEARRLHKRGMVAKEIVNTERTYVERLDTLIHVFLKPLKARLDTESPVLSEDTIAAIFSNIEDMVPINHAMLLAFEAAMSADGEQDNLGRVMFKYANFLKVYTPFINNFEPMIQRLDAEMEENEDFSAFLDVTCSLKVCNGLDLKAHLIMPIQRIPRYIILFEQLLKFTLKDDPEYSDIEKALTTVNSVAVRVNEAVKEQEKRDKLIKIMKTFSMEFDIMRPDRWLIKEGKITRISRRGPRQSMLYLFNDSLLYGDIQSSGLVKPKRLLMLRECHIRSEESTTTDDEDLIRAERVASLQSLSTTEKLRRKTVGFTPREKLVHRFQIMSKIDSFTVCTDSMTEKCEWISVLQKSVRGTREKDGKLQKTLKSFQRSKLQPLTPEEGEDSSEDEQLLPALISDKDATQCALCTSKFSFRNKRRRCQRCKQFVCPGCHFRGNSSILNLFGHHADTPTSICHQCAHATRDKRLGGVRSSTTSVPDIGASGRMSLDAPMSARMSREDREVGRRRSNSLGALKELATKVRKAEAADAIEEVEATRKVSFDTAHAAEGELVEEGAEAGDADEMGLPKRSWQRSGHRISDLSSERNAAEEALDSFVGSPDTLLHHHSDPAPRTTQPGDLFALTGGEEEEEEEEDLPDVQIFFQGDSFASHGSDANTDVTRASSPEAQRLPPSPRASDLFSAARAAIARVKEEEGPEAGSEVEVSEQPSTKATDEAATLSVEVAVESQSEGEGAEGPARSGTSESEQEVEGMEVFLDEESSPAVVGEDFL